MERTYVDSLDCVGLDGVRPIADVLVGYRETGRYRPDWWLIATHAGQDVGCVLLADHPEHDQCELMYLGMVPEVRGRGWGVEATRHVQWMMRGIARERMVLAVDDNNWPAQGVYSITGFDVWDRRCVYVRRARRTSRRGSPKLQHVFHAVSPEVGVYFWPTLRGFLEVSSDTQETSLKSWLVPSLHRC